MTKKKSKTFVYNAYLNVKHTCYKIRKITKLF